MGVNYTAERYGVNYTATRWYHDVHVRRYSKYFPGAALTVPLNAFGGPLVIPFQQVGPDKVLPWWRLPRWKLNAYNKFPR
jgi:hypothetical protein